MVPQAARCDAAESRSTLGCDRHHTELEHRRRPRRESGTHASDDPDPAARESDLEHASSGPPARRCRLSCRTGREGFPRRALLLAAGRRRTTAASLVPPEHHLFSGALSKEPFPREPRARLRHGAPRCCHLCDPPFFSANHIFASLNHPPTARARPLLVCSSCG